MAVKPRPYVLLKTALSLDGYIGGISGARHIFSDDADKRAVKELRAQYDAVLVGAGTLRLDNPRLQDVPIKVTMTATGRLDPALDFFAAKDGTKLVYTVEAARSALAKNLGAAAEVISAGSGLVVLTEVLEDLTNRGVKRLMIEGGSEIIRQVLCEGLADEMRLAFAPELIGDPRAAQFWMGVNFHKKTPQLRTAEKIGKMAVLWYSFEPCRN